MSYWINSPRGQIRPLASIAKKEHVIEAENENIPRNSSVKRCNLWCLFSIPSESWYWEECHTALGHAWPLPSGTVLLAQRKCFGQQLLSFCSHTAWGVWQEEVAQGLQTTWGDAYWIGRFTASSVKPTQTPSNCSKAPNHLVLTWLKSCQKDLDAHLVLFIKFRYVTDKPLHTLQVRISHLPSKHTNWEGGIGWSLHPKTRLKGGFCY